MEYQTSFHCAYHQTGKGCFSQFGHLVLSVFSNHILDLQVLFLPLHLGVPAEVSLTPSSSISEDVLELTHLLLAVAKRILQHRRNHPFLPAPWREATVAERVRGQEEDL